MVVLASRKLVSRSAMSLLASTALATMGAGIAYAQEIPIPPPFSNLDENGVDLVSDMFSVGVPVGSIGTGEGALSLTEYFGAIQGNSLQMGFRRVYSNGVATISITINNRSETFVGGASSTNFVSQQGTGATLVKNSAQQYTFTQRDGTVTSFGWPSNLEYRGGNSGFCSTKSQTSVCTLLANTTTYTSGQVITREWRVGETCVPYIVGGEPLYDNCAHFFRIASIRNRNNYKISFNYQSNTDPTTGLPATSWYIKTSAVFSNLSDTSATRTATFTDPYQSVVQITDVAGGLWRISRVNGVSLAGVRRPGSSVDNITMNAGTTGKVTQVVNDGVTTNYNYSVTGSQATMIRTNALSQTTTVLSDLNVGRATQVKDANGKSTNYTYDESSRPVRITMPEQNYVEYEYDGRGNVKSRRLAAKPGNGLADIVTGATYLADCTTGPLCDKPLTTVDTKGQLTNYEYDAVHGGVTKITSPAPEAGGVRPETRYGYTLLSSGLYALTSTSACQTTSSCVNGADEVRTTITYNSGNSLPQSVSTGAGNGSLTATQAFTYDAIGNLLTVDGPLAGAVDVTRYRYDTARRVVGITLPDPDAAGPRRPSATKYSYNGAGQVTQVQVGSVADQSDAAWNSFWEASRTTIGYDSYGRQNRQAVASGSTTYAMSDFVYDALGRPSCSITYMNSATWGAQASICAPSQTSGPNGPDRVMKKNYDAVGRLSSIEQGVGTSAASIEMAATYSDNGMQISAKDGENNLTTYEYDGFDRLLKTRFPNLTKGSGSSSTADFTQNSYDSNSNIIAVRLRDGQSIGMAYDNLNRLVFKDRPGAELDVSYSYDLLGRLTGALQAGNALTFGFDALGRNISQGGPLGTVQMQYDVAGRRTGLTWPDGFQVTYGYDNVAAMTSINDSSGIAASFGYDDLGRRTGLGRINGASTGYGYDTVSRLSGLTFDPAGTAYDLSLGFSYNPSSQINQKTTSNPVYSWQGSINTNRGYSANGLNQYTSAGTTGFAYDAKGNLTTSGSSNYGYDSENRLTSGPNAALNYDPLGRLYQVTSSSTNTRFLYAGTELIGEYGSTGQILRRYAHGPNADEPIVRYEEGSIAHRWFLHADERGSIVAQTDGAGNVFLVNSYDEYGIPGAGNNGRFQYTGQTWIPELGMYYYKARFYSPTLGRFMQTDPIGYADGMHLYNYVGGDPVNKTDSSGLYEGGPCGPADPQLIMSCGSTNIDWSWWLGVSLYETRATMFGGSRPGDAPAEIVVTAPQNDCSQAVVDFGNGLIDFANGLNDLSDKAIVGAGGVAVAGAVVGSTGLGLPLGLTAEGLAGGLAATGGLGKAIGGTVGLIGSSLVAGQTKNGSFTMATAFSAAAAWVTVKNPVASFFQDKMVSGASSLIGADKPPTSCPKGGR